MSTTRREMGNVLGLHFIEAVSCLRRCTCLLDGGALQRCHGWKIGVGEVECGLEVRGQRKVDRDTCC